MKRELKGVDLAFPATAGVNGYTETATTNADILVVNLIQTGNGSWNRVGKSVSLKSLRIRGFFKAILQNGTTIPSNFLRMAIVWDKQPSGGSIPTFNTIFGKTDQSGNETSEITDPLRYDNTGRFRVLRDCIYTINPQAAGENTDTTEPYVHVDEFINLKGLETIYSGQSTPMTINDISSGALYIVLRANNRLSSNSIEPLKMMYRLRYYD